MGNLVAYPYEKMLTRSPEKDDYFPELVDSIPEKVDVLIWLSQILALILYTITTNPLKMQYMTKHKTAGGTCPHHRPFVDDEMRSV